MELPAQTLSCPRSPLLARPRRRRRRRTGPRRGGGDVAAAGASGAFLPQPRRRLRLRLCRRRRCLLLLLLRLPHLALGSWPPAASPGSIARLCRRFARRQSGAGRRPPGRGRGPEHAAARLPPTTTGGLLLLPRRKLPSLPSCGPRPGRPRGSRSPAGAAPVGFGLGW